MALVSDAQVKQLLDLPSGDTRSMQIFIDQADLIVSEDLAGSGLSNDRLEMIELNLAAHFAVLAIEKGGFVYQKSMDSGEGYQQNKGAVKLSSTRFGQQAIAFDPTGKLASMDSPRGTAEFRVLGDTYNRSSGY